MTSSLTGLALLMNFRRICIFCGSSLGSRPVYRASAERMGGLLVERGIALVYGGGNIGLMGVLADTVLERGGQVIGARPIAAGILELAAGFLLTEGLIQRRGQIVALEAIHNRSLARAGDAREDAGRRVLHDSSRFVA